MKAIGVFFKAAFGGVSGYFYAAIAAVLLGVGGAAGYQLGSADSALDLSACNSARAADALTAREGTDAALQQLRSVQAAELRQRDAQLANYTAALQSYKVQYDAIRDELTAKRQRVANLGARNPDAKKLLDTDISILRTDRVQ